MHSKILLFLLPLYEKRKNKNCLMGYVILKKRKNELDDKLNSRVGRVFSLQVSREDIIKKKEVLLSKCS